MFTDLRDRIMATIRGNTERHGVIACLRCAVLEREIARVKAELRALENQATLHVAQRHILEHAEITPIRPETRVP